MFAPSDNNTLDGWLWNVTISAAKLIRDLTVKGKVTVDSLKNGQDLSTVNGGKIRINIYKANHVRKRVFIMCSTFTSTGIRSVTKCCDPMPLCVVAVKLSIQCSSTSL